MCPSTRAHRTERARIREELGQWHARADRSPLALCFYAEDLTPARADIADDLATAVTWHVDQKVHDRFEKNRTGLLTRQSESSRSRQLEDVLAGIVHVSIAIDEGHANAANGETAKDATAHGTLTALFHAADVLAGQRASANVIDEHEVLIAWFDLECEHRILSGAPTLLDMAMCHPCHAAHALAVRDTGCAEVHVHSMNGVESACGNFEIELPHARQRGLPRLGVLRQTKRRILDE